MAANHYIVLGVSSGSSGQEIKEAYRTLAKKYHPDHCGSDRLAFQKIQEAYAVLSDPYQRRKYDQLSTTIPLKKVSAKKIVVEPMRSVSGAPGQQHEQCCGCQKPVRPGWRWPHHRPLYRENCRHFPQRSAIDYSWDQPGKRLIVTIFRS